MASPIYIEDVLRLIIAELASDSDKKSLAHLAQTCKAFSDLCLDNLWHTMDSFCPFIPLLPRSVRSAIIGKGGVWYYCTTQKSRWSTLTQRLKTISHHGVRLHRPGKWESFDKYARRVRVYSQTEHCTTISNCYHKEAYQRVSAMRQKHLFPSLHKLVCTTLHPLESWSLPSPLRSLTIYQPDFTCLDEVLRLVAHDAPDLETLEIIFGFSDHSPPYRDTTVDPLPFNHLKSVTIRCPDLSTEVDIFHCLCLAPITVFTVTFSVWEKMWQPHSQVFHALEILTIEGNPASASLFIKHVCSTHLRQVGLTLYQNPDITFSDCQELLGTVLSVSKTHGQSLRKIYIAINSKKLLLKDPYTFDQLMKDFLSRLRFHVRGSAIETAIVVLPRRMIGEESDVKDGFWYYHNLGTEVLK